MRIKFLDIDMSIMLSPTEYIKLDVSKCSDDYKVFMKMPVRIHG